MPVRDTDIQKALERNPNLTKERVEEFAEAFALFDSDGNGTIDQFELQVVMNRVGKQYFTIDEIAQMISTIDLNRDGRIDFQEFVTLLGRSLKTDAEELVDAFNVFDVDGDGRIDAQEIQKVLGSLGQDITTEEIQLIMDDVDLDKDGCVNFEEFEAMMAFGPHRQPVA
eukprot:c9732_g1_i1.p1 GENE.c9732_g1_i1~~c9732_g1_i1.p1  ORF type:complete len:169 (+),score=49.65 c9732_g1_i1:68-574(+)